MLSKAKRPPMPVSSIFRSDQSISPEEMFRHTVKTARWIFAFAFGIWFLDF
jgi:hypothetical protein